MLNRENAGDRRNYEHIRTEEEAKKLVGERD
jgi:hypothetical protein